MFIEELLSVYRKSFGLWASLKRSSRVNKLIWIYIGIYIIDAGLFYYFFLNKEYEGVLFCIGLYIVLTFVSSKQSKYKLSKHRSQSSTIPGTEQFREVMAELKVTTSEEMELLDKVILEELALIKERRKYPLGDILRQLMVALLISGILAIAVFEIREGNIPKATSYFLFYIACLGVVAILNGALKTYLDFFGRHTQLMEVSSYIHLTRLSQSIENKRENENSISVPGLPARRKRR
ncbi:hypothetical protein [Bacillus sp. SG-1]|uniref:hypothetical protein n=1 Tax=Bacillus sp. SG-1 TaxID=161544 RepID=UPI0001543F9D|nr:hypothetical protein [Bacillus sp. SG-1]EDL65722.1 hypothetical protein BSG1_12646 [Bacillus sp. SG-1]